MPRYKILCIDDDRDFLISLSLQLRDDYKVMTSESIDQGLQKLKEGMVDLVILDVNLGYEDGIEGIGRIKQQFPDLDIVMLSGNRDPKTVVNAIREGAVDYLTKPFDTDALTAIIERERKNKQIREKYEALVETQNSCSEHSEIIFKSQAIQRLLNQAGQLVGHHANVLIVGETGTGKELLARYIHRQEGDSSRPFVAVNCAAIPEQLLETELFGSEVGAYTGAVKKRIGKFELADQGDIFLDEIGALRLDLQAKILRVLQNGEFCRLGGNEMIRVNFRVVAATNEALEEKVSRGEFRMDLYHRIRVIQLSLPSLRSRVEDIAVLTNYALNKFSKDGVVKKMTHGAHARLMAYHWPGNVRELMNVVHSLTILAPNDLIDESVFPSWAMNGCSDITEDSPERLPPIDHTVCTLKEYVSRAERSYIEHSLNLFSGDKSKTARFMDVGRTTLYNKMKDLGMM
ncbi:MAG: sigma-54-dependent Fis family transcriptional regulator [Deltaproteobacteria bacterium]|nr:sigma-54-dependent Fis family transcriptional regulator [Deltaproteobacteria bacterium]